MTALRHSPVLGGHLQQEPANPMPRIILKMLLQTALATHMPISFHPRSLPSNIAQAKLTLVPRIRNPLAGISRDHLKFRVSSLCWEYNLVDKQDVFLRGALVAQSPEDCNFIPGLTDQEKHFLSREATHRWHLPGALYFTIALCSLGSAI